MSESKPHSELRTEMDAILVKLDQAMGSSQGSWSEVEAMEQRRDLIIEDIFEQLEATTKERDELIGRLGGTL